MKKIILLLAAVLAAGSALENPFEALSAVFGTGAKIPSVRMINKAFDEGNRFFIDLAENNRLLVNYFPLAVPDVNMGFTADYQNKQTSGIWRLTNGRVYNVMNCRRYGDFDLSYDKQFFYIRDLVQFKDILILYNHLITFRDVEREVTVAASVELINVLISIRIDRHNLNVYFESAEIESASPIHVKVQEHSAADRRINEIFTFNTDVFENIIWNVVLPTVQEDLTRFTEELNSSHQ